MKVRDCYEIKEELDWYHEARGHFACVNRAHDIQRDEQVAFKVIRKEWLDAKNSPSQYDGEWEAFGIEVRALYKFHKHDFSIRFVDCGYVEVRPDGDMPSPNDEIYPLGTDEDAIKEFIASMPEYRKNNIRPYIVTEYVDQRWGTVFILDPENEKMYKRYPVTEVLNAISQFIDLIVYLQDNDYVYLDHKLAHTYWLLEHGQLKVIDWNGGFFLSDLLPSERTEKLFQENRHLIGMVMYGLLTGKPVPGYGKLAEMGRKMGDLIIPRECPGHALIQEFINETIRNSFKTAKDLRLRFNRLMLDYGMDTGDQLPDDENKLARERVDALMQQASEINNHIEKFAALLGQRNTLEGLPEQFREEVHSLRAAFRGLEEAQPIVLK